MTADIPPSHKKNLKSLADARGLWIMHPGRLQLRTINCLSNGHKDNCVSLTYIQRASNNADKCTTDMSSGCCLQ